SLCRNYSVSPEKETDIGNARYSSSPGKNDYGLSSQGATRLCSRKVLDVALAESSNRAEDRDELHVLSSGKLGEVALMEDMKASPERRETGTVQTNPAGFHHQNSFPPIGGNNGSGDEGGPGAQRDTVNSGGSGPLVAEVKTLKPKKGKDTASMNPAGKPIAVGLKQKKKPNTPKPPKKLKKNRSAPSEVDQSSGCSERCGTGGNPVVAQ
ncbi:hypothetical protein Ancab_036742, partial [Ancistrocladus abbreviatus]